MVGSNSSEGPRKKMFQSRTESILANFDPKSRGLNAIDIFLNDGLCVNGFGDAHINMWLYIKAPAMGEITNHSLKSNI